MTGISTMRKEVGSRRIQAQAPGWMDGSSTHIDGTRKGQVLDILQVELGSRSGAPRRVLGGSRVVRIGSMRKDAPTSPRTGSERAGKRPQQREEGMRHLHWWGQHGGDDHAGARAGKGGKSTGLHPPPPPTREVVRRGPPQHQQGLQAPWRGYRLGP